MDPREGQIARHQRRVPAPQPRRPAPELRQHAQRGAAAPQAGGPGGDHLRVLLEDLGGGEDEAGHGFRDGGGEAVDDRGGEEVLLLLFFWGGGGGGVEGVFDCFVGGEECAGCCRVQDAIVSIIFLND